MFESLSLAASICRPQKKYRAAGSSSSRNSRERTDPPDGRAADVGGVEIEHDFAQRLGSRIEKQIDEKPLDRRGIVADHAIVGRRVRGWRVLVAVQRALAGERLRRQSAIEAAKQHAEHGIAPQLVVVDQVLVAERQLEHPLGDQRFDRMNNIKGGAPIAKTGGEPSSEAPMRLSSVRNPG